MDELFRLRIAGKRQVTVPQRLMDLLGLSLGDELQVEVRGHEVRLVPMVQVPKSLVSPELLELLEAREQEARLYPFLEVEDASTFTAQVDQAVQHHDERARPRRRVGVFYPAAAPAQSAPSVAQTTQRKDDEQLYSYE